jgi:hypothetical protein
MHRHVWTAVLLAVAVGLYLAGATGLSVALLFAIVGGELGFWVARVWFRRNDRKSGSGD